MSIKSIKRLLRDSVYDHMTAQLSPELGDTNVVKPLTGHVLETSHIRITTPTTSSQKAGEVNLARWEVACHISVVTQTDDISADEHDDLVGLVEAYILQGNKILAAFLTTSELQVDNVFIGESSELEIGSMRHSMSEIKCECYKKVVA
ncbi:MAG: hypothetical protein GY833_23965 [Aestuariibacter sp.]|nr:hypothetical protein [Aestuariibacter sp.]